MSSYKYYKTVEEKVDVSPCPCCGHEDLKFYNFNRDDSMHGAGAGVVCNNCGHKVKVDGNEIESDYGNECQLHAIDRWNMQYRMYGNPEVNSLKKRLSEVEHENGVLKHVLSIHRFDITVNPWDSEGMKLYDEFYKIMGTYLDGRRPYTIPC